MILPNVDNNVEPGEPEPRVEHGWQQTRHKEAARMSSSKR
jgi:hypothetical protein